MLKEKVRRVHLQNVGEEIGFLQEGGHDLMNSKKFSKSLFLFVGVYTQYRSIYVKMLERRKTVIAINH